jgi:hypothetical protein
LDGLSFLDSWMEGATFARALGFRVVFLLTHVVYFSFTFRQLALQSFKEKSRVFLVYY